MIEEFKGEYRFLSNFWPASVQGPSGYFYACVENAYQASKTLDKTVHLKMTNMRPGESKRAGRELIVRSDWESVKIEVMYDLVKKKFTNHWHLAAKLLATGDQPLIEGNHWGDTFWGVCKGIGNNHLGEILMEIRRGLITAITPD